MQALKQAAPTRSRRCRWPALVADPEDAIQLEAIARGAERLSRREDHSAQSASGSSSRCATSISAIVGVRPGAGRARSEAGAGGGSDCAAHRQLTTTTRACRSRRCTRSVRWSDNAYGPRSADALLAESAPELTSVARRAAGGGARRGGPRDHAGCTRWRAGRRGRRSERSATRSCGALNDKEAAASAWRRWTPRRSALRPGRAGGHGHLPALRARNGRGSRARRARAHRASRRASRSLSTALPVATMPIAAAGGNRGSRSRRSGGPGWTPSTASWRSENNPDLLLAGQFASVLLSNGQRSTNWSTALRERQLRDRALRYLIDVRPDARASSVRTCRTPQPALRIDLLDALGLSGDPAGAADRAADAAGHRPGGRPRGDAGSAASSGARRTHLP